MQFEGNEMPNIVCYRCPCQPGPTAYRARQIMEQAEELMERAMEFEPEISSIAACWFYQWAISIIEIYRYYTCNRNY